MRKSILAFAATALIVATPALAHGPAFMGRMGSSGMGMPHGMMRMGGMGMHAGMAGGMHPHMGGMPHGNMGMPNAPKMALHPLSVTNGGVNNGTINGGVHQNFHSVTQWHNNVHNGPSITHNNNQQNIHNKTVNNAGCGGSTNCPPGGGTNSGCGGSTNCPPPMQHHHMVQQRQQQQQQQNQQQNATSNSQSIACQGGGACSPTANVQGNGGNGYGGAGGSASVTTGDTIVQSSSNASGFNFGLSLGFFPLPVPVAPQPVYTEAPVEEAPAARCPPHEYWINGRCALRSYGKVGGSTDVAKNKGQDGTPTSSPAEPADNGRVLKASTKGESF